VNAEMKLKFASKENDFFIKGTERVSQTLVSISTLSQLVIRIQSESYNCYSMWFLLYGESQESHHRDYQVKLQF
jgi:hypothetical protein